MASLDKRSTIRRLLNLEKSVKEGSSTVSESAIADILANPDNRAGSLLAEKADKIGIDARQFGLQKNTNDSAPALNAAAEAARAQKVPLIIPEGTYYIDSTVNLRYLEVQSYARIRVRHTDSPGVIVGDASNQRNELVIRLRDVEHVGSGIYSVSHTHPAIQVIGLKGGTLDVGASTFLQFYAASTNVSRDGSIAYNNVVLGRINKLELISEGSGWINENLFLGGSLTRLTINGDYSANNNKWIKPAIEGVENTPAIFDIAKGYSNVFEDVRFEGVVQIKFGPRSVDNYIYTLWKPHRSLISALSNIEDLNGGNVVTSRTQQDLRRHTILRLDSNSEIYGTATEYGTFDGAPIPSVGGGFLASSSQWGYMLDVTLPVRNFDYATPITNRTLNPETSIDRLLLFSDRPVLRVSVSGYDKDGIQIDPNVEPFFAEYADLSLSQANKTYYTSVAVRSVQMTIINPRLHSIKIMSRTGAARGQLFRHITLSAYTSSTVDPGVVDQAQRAVKKPIFLTTAPSSGLAFPGTVIQGPDRFWKATSRTETRLGAPGTDSTITVENTNGLAPGDVIGVQLDTEVVHWSTVSGVEGNVVTLSTALPSPASSDRSVGTTRWVEVIS